MALTQVRQNIVNECDWGVAHNASIHYTQDLSSRDQSLHQWQHHSTPMGTDCSGALTDIFYTAGAPDPSGYAYNSIGNTGSLYSNAEHIKMADLLPGDFIICFKGAESEHVYIIRKKLAGSDYQLFTHGDESCPKFENLSAVSGYWNGIGHMQACRTLPVVPNYRWAVLSAHKVIAKTKHPAMWAAAHPKSFRKYDWVRFRKDVL